MHDGKSRGAEGNAAISLLTFSFYWKNFKHFEVMWHCIVGLSSQAMYNNPFMLKERMRSIWSCITKYLF